MMHFIALDSAAYDAPTQAIWVAHVCMVTALDGDDG